MCRRSERRLLNRQHHEAQINQIRCCESISGHTALNSSKPFPYIYTTLSTYIRPK